MPGAETFRASADAYDRLMGRRYAIHLAPVLIEFAGVAPDMPVLDVGCGAGALTGALAERVGARNVTAADPSPPFVEACRARVGGATVVQAPAESLPFDDGTFAATLSQLVVNFMTDPAAGLAEMVRVTRRGGTVASAVWDYGGGMTMLRRFWEAACEVDADRAATVDERVRMPLCREGQLADHWRAGGLRDVREGALVVHGHYADFEDLWSPFLGGVGPSGAFCAALAPDARERLKEALRRRLDAPDGPFELSARAWVAAGIKP